MKTRPDQDGTHCRPVYRQALAGGGGDRARAAGDPPFGHAQGIVRGAQDGSYEGNRIAGPVGGVVGGAVGAGVGGAMGAVKGVFGITDRGYRCRGYYDRHDRFHCYR